MLECSENLQFEEAAFSSFPDFEQPANPATTQATIASAKITDKNFFIFKSYFRDFSH